MNQKRKDLLLADFTDVLLNGGDWDVDQQPPLADTVSALARSLSPKPVPHGLQRNVLRRVQTEWVKSPLPWSRRLFNLFRRPDQRLVWAMMTALILLAVGVLFILPSDIGNIAGTANGGISITLLLLVVMLTTFLVVAWYLIRGKKQ